MCIDDLGSKFYLLHIISHDMRADDDSVNSISNGANILHLPTKWSHGLQLYIQYTIQLID
jgi:hypothetical protein